jgi:hypothetical protein
MFGAFKYRTKNEPRQRAQLPFRQRMPAARGFMPLPAPMTRQPQIYGGGLGGLLRFLRPQIFRQPQIFRRPQRRGGLFGGLGSIFMPRRTPDFNPNVRRGGFLGGLGGLFGGRMGGFGGLFGRRFAEGGEVDAVPMQQGGDPFAANIVRTETGMDPITRQLLFGLDGKGGFIPGAFRAAEKTFFDEEGKARVVPEEVAGFSADQLRAQELARQAVGTQDPFLQQARAAYQTGIADLDRGLTEQADLLRTTAGAYDPSMTQRFMDPYEQAVVDRTSQDLIEQFAKSDIGSRAQDIVRGGASAFGSRGKLGAAERTRALGRGLAEAIGGIRSRGFQQAQSTGLGEFARQQAARRALAGGLGSIGAARQAGQFGLASALTGLGTQAAGARAGDIGMLSNLGLSQQQLAQQQLDAQRRNLLTAQQAPLAQFSALRPFVGMAPQGQFQTQTTFVPPPSPLQAGLATGLSAFGALGNFFNQGQPQQYPGLPPQFQG